MGIRWAVTSVLAACAVLCAWPAGRAEPRYAVPAAVPTSSEPVFESRFLPRADGIATTHGATLARTGGGDLLAVWYGGSKEAALDVCLYQARFRAGQWERPQRLVGPEDVTRAAGRYSRRVGNPALARDGAGRFHLFFVSTTAGGWAASSLNRMVTEDGGTSWSAPRRLVTNPFLNLSTLARQPGVVRADGGFDLPAYHELRLKFPELLRFDADGRLIDKVRMDPRHGSLQPAVVPLTDRRAVAFLRDRAVAGGYVLRQESNDGGESWTRAEPTPLMSPDASVAAGAWADGTLVVAYNPTYHRNALVLATETSDWKALAILELRAELGEFSYPTLVVDGEWADLIYTWRRETFRHVRFNRAWFDKQRAESLPAGPDQTDRADVGGSPAEGPAPRVGSAVPSLAELTGFGGHVLLWCAMGLLFTRVRSLSLAARFALLGGLALAAIAPGVAVGPAGFTRGLLGDLSAPTLALLGLVVVSAVRGCPRGGPRVSRVACVAVVAVAVPLYLGSTGFWPSIDPYRAGYQPRQLLLAAAVAAGVLAACREAVLASALVAAVFLFSLGALGSTNLWDYLGDPVFGGYALVRIVLPRSRSVAVPVAVPLPAAIPTPAEPPSRKAA